MHELVREWLMTGWRAVWLGAVLAATSAHGSEPGVAGSGPREAEPAPLGAVGGAAVAWQGPVTLLTGPAKMGPWRMNRSRFHYVDDPAVALTADGRVGLAWVDNRLQDVFFAPPSRWDGGPVQGGTNVSRSPETFSWLPRVLMGGTHEVYVLWQEIVFSGGSHGGEAFFARSGDGGRSFGEPLNLSNSEAGDGKGRLSEEHWQNGSLDLVQTPEGTLIAAWTEYEGALWVARSSDGGRSFAAPRQVAGSPRTPARGPDLAAADGGAVYLVWAVGEDPNADIRFAVSSDDGRSFSDARTLFPGPGHADAPTIAAGTDGRLHLAYAEGFDGPFGPHGVRYARLDPQRLEEMEPRVVAEASGSRSVHFPALGLDGRGNLVIAFETFPEATGRPYGLGFTVSRDEGASFSAPAMIPGSAEPGLGFNGSLQGLLMEKLDVNAIGQIAVVNSRFKRGERSLIRLIRGALPGR